MQKFIKRENEILYIDQINENSSANQQQMIMLMGQNLEDATSGNLEKEKLTQKEKSKKKESNSNTNNNKKKKESQILLEIEKEILKNIQGIYQKNNESFNSYISLWAFKEWSEKYFNTKKFLQIFELVPNPLRERELIREIIKEI